MRNEELHAAVLAAPDDDAPRLVYADWLSEHGDPRGELIAIELARAKLPPGDARDPELAARRNALWAAHGFAWVAPFHPNSPELRRGFVEEIRDSIGGPLNLDGESLRDACLRSLVLCNRASLAALARSLQHAPLRELVLHLSLEPDELAALLTRDGLARLEALTLGGPGIHAGHVDAIAAANLANLRALALTRPGAGDGAAADTFAALARWNHASLRSLRLEYSAIGAGALAPVLHAAPFAALEVLRLPGTGLGEDDVAAICASTLPLVELDVGHNALGPVAARGIASTPRFATLAMLGLADTTIGADGLAALVASPHLAPTCRLAIDGELLGLTPDVWIDQDVVTGASWSSKPRGELTERFQIVVEGAPRWETCLKYL